MKLLYKTITANTQVSTQECYFVGAELSNTANTYLVVYDESDSSRTATRKVANLGVTSYDRFSTMMFPDEGVKMEGIYVWYDEGIGTIYYHY